MVNLKNIEKADVIAKSIDREQYDLALDFFGLMYDYHTAESEKERIRAAYSAICVLNKMDRESLKKVTELFKLLQGITPEDFTQWANEHKPMKWGA